MFSNSNNKGRGGLFAPMSKNLALAHDIATNGWLETSFIILDKDSDSLPLASMGNVLSAQIDTLKRHDNEGKPLKYKVGEKSYTVDQLESAVKAWTEAQTDMGKGIAIGNNRALACVLCWSLGFEVVPNIKESEVSTELAIRDNAAHAFASRLDDTQKLKSAMVLMSEGKINKESDLRKVYGHHGGQKLWLQLQAVEVHKLSTDEAINLKPTKEVRDLIKAPPSKATKNSLKSMVEDKESQGTKAKTLPAVKIVELASQFPMFADLLNSIANGQELGCRTWLAGHTVASIDHGLES